MLDGRVPNRTRTDCRKRVLVPYYRCPACGLTTYSAAAYSSEGVCPSCATLLADDSRFHVMPGATGDSTRVLPVRPEAAGDARRSIAALPVGADVREKLALLVSELVTNSVRHAGLSPDDAITLRITNRGGRIRVAIRDGGKGFALDPRELLGRARDSADEGRGLQIVDDVADAWGADRDADGFTVWCEVESEQARAAGQQLTAG